MLLRAHDFVIVLSENKSDDFLRLQKEDLTFINVSVA
jgi:hypothetical protein